MSSAQGPSHAFDDLVDECLDEASFLWGRWEQELSSPTRNLDETWSWTEDRLHGALDGVRTAGARFIEVGRAALASDETNRVTVGAALLGSSSEQAASEAIVSALSADDLVRLDAIVRGLELLGSSAALRAAAAALDARATAQSLAALCRLKAFRRVAPGRELPTAFQSGDPGAQASAVRAARYLPVQAATEWIERALHDTTPVVRHAAVEAGARLGLQGAWRTAVQLARQLDPDSGAYLTLVALLGSPEDHEVVYSALRLPALQRHAVWALGHIGTTRAAETCIAGMKHDALARACGEAYCWMTGANLSRDRLARAEPQEEVPAFEDDDLDANLVPPQESLWPMPDVDAVRQHWETLRPSMHATARHVRGTVASTATLLEAIESGPMHRRPDVVLELAARTRGRYDVETRAFASRQRQMMAASRTAIAAAGES